ncbi:MAG TPA: hypothetical protein VMT75_10810 [Candidatus Saccharimonadales bacterium]|nr:hypothetical protein [Candidatus Saccharimonadales bacterium]
MAPGVDAPTEYVPAFVFAAKTADVATPLELVVAVLTPPAKVPLAPAVGAVNVTTAPAKGDPFWVTSTTKGAAKAVLTVALWPDPLCTVTTGGKLLVRLKLAGVDTPAAEAVTV